MADRPYSRVYWEVIDDLRFVGIYDSDRNLSTWIRLLIGADAMYPSAAPLPRGASGAAVSALIGAGLVEMVGKDHYRLHGMASERASRSDRGRAGGIQRATSAVRDDAGRFAGEDAGPAYQRGPNQRSQLDETSKDETSKDETSKARAAEEEPEGEAITWLARHGCYIVPGNGYHRQLIAAVEHHGVNAVIGMFDRLAEAGTTEGDIKGYIFSAKDALDARTRPDLTVIVKEEERAEDKERRDAASKRQLAELSRYIDEEPMPEEQRTANLARLRSEMAEKGLIS